MKPRLTDKSVVKAESRRLVLGQLQLALRSDGSDPQPQVPAAAEGAGDTKKEAAKADVQISSQAVRLVAIAESAEVFHAPDGTGFVSVIIGDHRETWPVKSKSFQRYLVRKFYEATRKAPSSKAFQDAIALIEAKAQFDGPEEMVFVRVGERDGSLWLDLGDSKWRAVEVTATGWRIVDDPPIRFRRAPGMLPLPAPARGGTVAELDPFINTACDADRVLTLSWAVAAMRPRGPYPILNLHGEQGSAKSTASKVLRALIDPYRAPLRTAPRDERDLQIAAKNSHVIALDNMSHLEPWLSDALCRLATGGGLGTRQLYTDEEEVLFDAQRPILLNGIEDLGTRGDFLERSIVLHLPPISETARRDEEEFWTAFDAARPRILGALLHAVSVAQRTLEFVRLEQMPRMADFAKWSVAAEPGLGLGLGTFLEAYAGSRVEAANLALESSPVVPHIRALLEADDNWTGTASELLKRINSIAGEKSTRERGWPKTPRALSGALRRLAPSLRAIGVDVIFLDRESGRRPIALSKLAGEPSRPSLATAGAGSVNCRPSGLPSPSQDPLLLAHSKDTVHDGHDSCDDRTAAVEVDL